jgi:OmpA-OmpF porin, OOP family
MKQLSKSLRSIKRLSRMGCITLSLMLIGSAIAQGIPGTSFSRQSTVGETYNLKNTQIAADQSRIIFYRPTHARTGETSTIYINGRYQTSLISGAYSLICMRPGQVEIGVRQLDNQTRRSKDGLDSSRHFTLQSGQNLFIRVNEDDAPNITLTSVTPADAKNEISVLVYFQN